MLYKCINKEKPQTVGSLKFFKQYKYLIMKLLLSGKNLYF